MYLGHDFVITSEPNHQLAKYTCKKCKCNAMTYGNEAHSKYHILIDKNTFGNISCDEYIIKKLLE